MNSCIKDRAEIIVGSKAEFSVFLEDDEGLAIDLNNYVSGKIIFCNCKGERSEIAFDVPGTNPTQGEAKIVVPSVETAKADEKWQSADVELVDATPETTVVLLNNKFIIQKRNCPPVV